MADAAAARPAALFSLRVILAAWLPAVAITVLHNLTGPELHWLHDILRRLYYLPILFGAFSCGLRGGLALSVAVIAAYSPHAFTHLIQIDPAHTLEKALELLLYLVVGGVAGVLVDRERRRLEELSAATEQLKRSLEEQRQIAEQLVRAGRLAALGEMVAGIAHEIKNPLHAMRGTAEVVDAVVPGDAPERRMWELHLKEIRRLETVAERFLSFARPAPLERREVDLRKVIEHTRDLMEAQAHQRGVSIVIEPPAAGVDGVLKADGQQLAQVLLNISLNATQAIGDGEGTIRFSLGQERRGEQRFHVVRVENDGPPIPLAERERIFDPFVTTKGDGAGLGLSIAARIVEQHGGFIAVEGGDGVAGVAFLVFLPE